MKGAFGLLELPSMTLSGAHPAGGAEDVRTAGSNMEVDGMVPPVMYQDPPTFGGPCLEAYR